MKVAELLESRRANWRALEALCAKLEHRQTTKTKAAERSRFAALYRAACADLALADAYQLPPATVHYLHQLVGRAHNQLYRSQKFNFRAWWHEMFYEVPQRLFMDRALWLAMLIFWGIFLSSMFLAYTVPQFAYQVVNEDQRRQLEESFAEPMRGRGASLNVGMAGFYVWNNAGIGLQCFAAGLLLGIGGLVATVFNAAHLGAAFGYMMTVPQRPNFYEFVTAHGPFELTAIVMSAAAGMRLGFSIVDTGGYTRMAALRKAGARAMPAMGAATAFFAFAALIESFVSPSAAPYSVKVGVAIISIALMVFYIFVLGFPRKQPRATG